MNHRPRHTNNDANDVSKSPPLGAEWPSRARHASRAALCQYCTAPKHAIHLARVRAHCRTSPPFCARRLLRHPISHALFHRVPSGMLSSMAAGRHPSDIGKAKHEACCSHSLPAPHPPPLPPRSPVPRGRRHRRCSPSAPTLPVSV